MPEEVKKEEPKKKGPLGRLKDKVEDVWWYTYLKLCDNPWIATAEDRSNFYSQCLHWGFSYVRGSDGKEI